MIKSVYNSHYNKKVVVEEDGSICKLIFQPELTRTGWAREQGAIDRDDLRKHFFDYSLLAMYSLNFFPEPIEKVLVVGLGAGVIPREMNHFCPETQIDVIEIDPLIVDIAKGHFYYTDDEGTTTHISYPKSDAVGELVHRKNPKVHTYIGDAWTVIDTLKENDYDIVVLDAYEASYIPFQLMTSEFIEKVKKVVKEDGVVSANLCNAHPSYHPQLATFYSVFGDRFYTMEGPNNGNATMLSICNHAPNYKFPFPKKYYPSLKHESFPLWDDLKNIDFFSMRRF